MNNETGADPEGLIGVALNPTLGQQYIIFTQILTRKLKIIL
jgi:hypothetical protein